MSDSIDNEIFGILAKHTQLENDKITPDTRLDSIGVDSLLMVEIIFDLEEHFDISIPDPDFVGEQSQQFKTAADVVRNVKEVIQQQKAQ
jgi:acyl carrier protein